MTRRSFESARCSRSKRLDLRRKVRLDGQRRRGCLERPLVGFGERVAAVLGMSQLVLTSVHDSAAAAASAAEPDRLADAAPHRDAETEPDCRERQARARSAQRDQHDVEANEAVLKLGDHRRRRVPGGALPDPALYGGDEIDDPGSYRDAERQDRGGGRMLGERRRGRGECDRQPGVQEVTDSDRRELRQSRRCRRNFSRARSPARRAASDEPSCQAAPAPWLRARERRASRAAVRS